MNSPGAPFQKKGQSGQAAVESAIVLPLFVFLILGILQLGLMHQARLLTKYAAYKAVRAGALHSANRDKMERAALAVLLPMVGQAGNGGGEYIKAVGSASEFQAKWASPGISTNIMTEGGLKYAKVSICGPTREELASGTPSRNSQEMDFDDPDYTASGSGSAGDIWRQIQRTKLRIQVTFNYRMHIPFADMVIYNMVRARDLPSVLRLGKASASDRADGAKYQSELAEAGKYDAAASQGLYIMPIRATYTMRMQSNYFLTRNALPERNECYFSFDYSSL